MNMSDIVEQLASWLEELDGKYPAEWSMLPDIGLYMDQVQTYIDRQLGLYRRDASDRLLTPAMINNYIKDNLIPRADIKKYAPVHLALLIMIGTMKQVLSIPNLNQLLSAYRESAEVEDLYSRFLQVQRASLHDNCSQVLEETKELPIPLPESGGDKETAAALRNLALELSIEARTRILIAEKIISLLADPKAEDPGKKASVSKSA
jgi:hypothetical protein